jgi:hypothetical protein
VIAVHLEKTPTHLVTCSSSQALLLSCRVFCLEAFGRCLGNPLFVVLKRGRERLASGGAPVVRSQFQPHRQRLRPCAA